jgi:hypothetical protein
MNTPGIDILNCGRGHAEVHFDNGDPVELERGKRIIEDMLRRGYVLFIEGADKALIRVESFNAERGTYIIADGPLYAGDEGAVTEPEPTAAAPDAPSKRGRGRQKREVGIATVKTTAIARSAGG